MIKRLFIFLSYYLPPPVNRFFLKLGGVNFFDVSSCWVGLNCYIDNYSPDKIQIGKNVCICAKVIILTHFDPRKAIKNHVIKNYSKNVIIEDGVFIGPGAILFPGTVLRKNSFVEAGAVVKGEVLENQVVSGNPAIVISNLHKN